MSELQLAANLVQSTAAVGLNWGHLQIVYGSEEIEAQSPLGDPIAPSNWPWTLRVFGPRTANVSEYASTVSLDIGDRDSTDVWELLESINTQFVDAAEGSVSDYPYLLGQNSNSYVNTLLWMVGIDLGAYIQPLITESNEGLNGINGPTAEGIAVTEAAILAGSLFLGPFGFHGNGVITGAVFNNDNFWSEFPGWTRNMVTDAYDTSFQPEIMDFMGLLGTDGGDFLRTGDGDDSFLGGDGDDEYWAGSGDDILIGDRGADKLYGEAGIDTADYSGTTDGADTSGTQGIEVQVNTDAEGTLSGKVLDNWGSYDDLNSVEIIIGTDEADVFEVVGDAYDAFADLDKFDARGQSDDGAGDVLDLSSTTGNASITINLADESAFAERAGDLAGFELLGFENIIGSAQADTITGDAGDNIIEGGGGGDTIDGGDGIDFITFNLAESYVEVDLVWETGHIGDAEGDEYSNIEGVTGSEFGDAFWTNTYIESRLAGGDGADEFYVYQSDDSGLTPTVLWGGEGSDQFWFYGDTSDPLGIMVANVEDLTLENFADFDISVLNLGDDVAWSEIDVLLLNPDASDLYYYGSDPMGVGDGHYKFVTSAHVDHWQEDGNIASGEVYGSTDFQTFYAEDGVYTDYYNGEDSTGASHVVVDDFDVSFLGSQIGTVFGGGASVTITYAATGLDEDGEPTPESEDWYGILDSSTAEFTGEWSDYWEEEDYTSYSEHYY